MGENWKNVHGRSVHCDYRKETRSTVKLVHEKAEDMNRREKKIVNTNLEFYGIIFGLVNGADKSEF